MLRPFTVEKETQVRQNLFKWTKNIRDTPGLSPELEQRVLTLLAQLIEQRFRTLSYKELSKMLQLTPFKETESFQEALHEDRVELLTRLIRHKFNFAKSTIDKLTSRL